MQGTSFKKVLLCLGLLLFVPGLAALGYSFVDGPVAWSLDSKTYWGVPVSLFVFWIGLAHAGTLISAILLALGIQLDRRTAMLAELSTLVSLAIAAVFPLMHLGVVENFFMVAPFADVRGNFANVRSPLVWDFCCIAVYGLLSLAFFLVHLKAEAIPALTKLRKPMAWLLFPLVLWVHTIVSLDFATTFVPEWRGAFFPMYFIVGAIYSGLALVNALLCAEGYRVRLLERLMLAGSWFLVAIWIWDYLLKGSFCTSAFVLAGVIPQLLILERVRDSRWGRDLINMSILVGLYLERYYLVMPGRMSGVNPLNLVDYGLMAFSVGTFLLLFFGIRAFLDSNFSSVGTYFGEVDGSDMAQNETSEVTDDGYKIPWTTIEFRMLRIPLLIGLLTVILFCIWCLNQNVFENTQISLVNAVPVIYPIVASVAFVSLMVKFIRQNRILDEIGNTAKILIAVLVLVVAFVCGLFYAGGSSAPSNREVASEPYVESFDGSLLDSGSIGMTRIMWNSRCATCHGTDGKFNKKFVREFYPLPQKLDTARVDSLGIDSLVNVVLYGRNNMNAYGSRLTESEARGLVEYMRILAKEMK